MEGSQTPTNGGQVYQLTRRFDELSTRVEQHRQAVDEKFDAISKQITDLRVDVVKDQAKAEGAHEERERRVRWRQAALATVSGAAFLLSVSMTVLQAVGKA